jgi:hypothetical protein
MNFIPHSGFTRLRTSKSVFNSCFIQRHILWHDYCLRSQLLPLRPKDLPQPLISNTISLCSSMHITDLDSHPYITTFKIKSALYFNLFIFEDKTQWKELLGLMVAGNP